MARTPLSIGLVGCGRLAEVGYVPALVAAQGVRLAAVADPDLPRRERVAALAESEGARPVATFPDAATLVGQGSLHGVILATPAAAHFADAVLAASAGLAVLVEKPPAPDAAGAADLAGLNPAPWVGFNRRFDPGVMAVKAAVPPAGPVALKLEISYRRQTWSAHQVHDDAVLDLGPHLVDLARWLTGSEVVEVAAIELALERAVLEVTLTRGRASIRAAADRPHHELVEVRDGAGELLARHRSGGLVAGVAGRLLRRGDPHPLVASLVGQLEAFAVAVAAGAGRGSLPSETSTVEAAADQGSLPLGTAALAAPRGRPPLGTAADGVAVMTAIDAARASAARHGRPVRVQAGLPG